MSLRPSEPQHKCSTCQQLLPASDFSLGPRGGRQRRCTECASRRGSRAPSSRISESICGSITGLGEQDSESSSALSSIRQDVVAASEFKKHLSNFGAFTTATTSSLTHFADAMARMEQALQRLSALPPGPPPLPPANAIPSGAIPNSTTLMGPPQVIAPNTGGEFTLNGACNWVKADLVDLVARDALEPEDLVRLRHPSHFFGGIQSESVSTYSIDSDGIKVKSNDAPKRSAFIKAVPNILSLSQLWTIFVGIRAFFVKHDPSLLTGYLLHLHELINLSSRYSWESVVNYHLEVHWKRMLNQGTAQEWSTTDMNAFVTCLAPTGNLLGSSGAVSGPIRGRNVPLSRPAPYMSQGQTHPHNGMLPYNLHNCQKFNHSVCAGCSRPHRCARCNGFHALASCNSGSGSSSGLASVPSPYATGVNSLRAAPNGQGAATK